MLLGQVKYEDWTLLCCVKRLEIQMKYAGYVFVEGGKDLEKNAFQLKENMLSERMESEKKKHINSMV